MSETETTIESWDGLLTNYLKADNLVGEIGYTEDFACSGVKVNGEEMNLILERKDEKFVFSLNTTNRVFLKNNGINVPKDVIGKKVTLVKMTAFSPTQKKEVDSLRITKVE